MKQHELEQLAVAAERLKEKFNGHLRGKPDMLKSSMIAAYEKGLKDHLAMIQEQGFDIVRKVEAEAPTAADSGT